MGRVLEVEHEVRVAGGALGGEDGAQPPHDVHEPARQVLLREVAVLLQQ